MPINGYITVDNMKVPLEGEDNLLKVVRKAGIDLPTFCYHSQLSSYGACRMCVVEVERMGIVASCSVPPTDGMVVRTNTERLRRIRKTILELLLANHDRECTTCGKSSQCKLQELSERFAVSDLRFGKGDKRYAIDHSTPAIVRDPNKCILCGDCVRMCAEVQGVGILDFMYRGSKAMVGPAFGKPLAEVDCVQCGQCTTVCPTGALMLKSYTADVWKALDDPKKTVMVQIAPAVRVALGEEFGMKPGEIVTGKIVAALRRLGFDLVFDTCFTADLTIIEEGNEFVSRLKNGGVLPQFTSCCPGWVKYVEQYHPELIPNISSCKSPQQMFGSVAKKYLAKDMNLDPKDVVVVSIMPCTAKKFEANRPEFSHDGMKDVDYVLSTRELARMIKEAGFSWDDLEIESFDVPFGLGTGAGVIFGNTGGVTEAVLRSTQALLGAKTDTPIVFNEVRGLDGIKEAVVNVEGIDISLAIANSLSAAEKLIEEVQSGKKAYHIIEVMACPGGCIGGGGQPISADPEAKAKRARGLYEADKGLMIRRSHENPYVAELYKQHLGEANSHEAHENLHTEYGHRKRILGEDIKVMVTEGKREGMVDVAVCLGTSCYLKGSYNVLHALMNKVDEMGLADRVNLHGTFCFENCHESPCVKVNGEVKGYAGTEDVAESIIKDRILPILK